MRFSPYDYQARAIEKIKNTPYCGLFLEMGLGKTVIALTAARDLIADFDIDRVLVVAPLKVAEDTWSREVGKWDHLAGLTVSKILGDRKTRTAAAEAEADIYVINRENLAWLVDEYGNRWRWDMVILDELSSFKNSRAQRFKAFKKVRPFCRRVVGLTGTPNPNGLIDLWAEIYCLDRGARLERTLGRYRDLYFKPGRRNGYVVFDWVPVPGAGDAIARKVEDITVSMKAKDYIELPERIDNDIRVQLTPKAADIYKTLERQHIVELFNGEEITAMNAAAVMNKLLQLSGGAVYADDGGWVPFHDEKLKALDEILDTTTEPVLVFYGYRHERERIIETLAKYDPQELRGPEDISAWNEGRTRLLVAHPASAGYGLNLQEGGRTVVWYSLPWSLELYQQANARLYRQGQTRPVIINHLIADGTADEAVIKSLHRKDTGQAALMAALKERREEVSKHAEQGTLPG